MPVTDVRENGTRKTVRFMQCVMQSEFLSAVYNMSYFVTSSGIRNEL